MHRADVQMAVEEELIPVAVYQSLTAVAALRKAESRKS